MRRLRKLCAAACGLSKRRALAIRFRTFRRPRCSSRVAIPEARIKARARKLCRGWFRAGGKHHEEIFTLVSILTMLVGLSVLPALAQSGTVKGSAKDENGKPSPTPRSNWTTPRPEKMTTKNGKGEWTALGVQGGTYNAILDRQRRETYRRLRQSAGCRQPGNYRQL